MTICSSRAGAARPPLAVQEPFVADILPSLQVEVARVDDLLRESVGSTDGFLAGTPTQAVGSERNRLRSTLTLTTAYATRGSIDKAVIGGAACELVQLGTRFHDDVIDEAEIRRGVPSINAHWSNCVAILTGDLFLARASSLAAALGAEVAALLAETIGNTCRGQLFELQHLYDVNRTEENYETAIAGKTTSLFAASCRIGGMVSGAPETTLAALSRFGHHFGVCVQIVDDTLAGSSTTARLTKPDRDLRDGIYTLPVIYAMRDSSELRSLLGGPLDNEQLARARSIVDASSANDVALDIARSHAVKASSALEGKGCTALIHFAEDLGASAR